MIRNYIGVVHKEPRSCYGISFPDFPGCVSTGDTLDELHDMGIEALQFHVEGILADGDAIPEASSLEHVKKATEGKAADAFLVVPVEIPEKAVRINVTIQDSVLRKIDNYAQRHSETRSAVLASAAVEYIKSHK
jgi:predicted RNase H-like HicB family nuclease